MFRALLAGISGLRNHQLRLDVIGNNIANANTIGYKSSRVTFEEGFAQVLSQARAAAGGRGSSNPSQVGAGVTLGSVDPRFTQGTLEATGRPFDLALQGDGLFVLGGPDGSAYSRAGNFQLDADGRLVLGGTGLALQGVNASSDGTLTGGIGEIRLDLDTPAPARATSRIELSGNLDAEAEPGTTHDMTTTIYDAKGQAYSLTFTFTKQEDGSWSWAASSQDEGIEPGPGGSVRFDEDGSVAEFTYDGGRNGLTLSPGQESGMVIQLVADGPSGLTSLAGATTGAVRGQDGRRAGELVNVQVTGDGTIQGVYANGERKALARIALATFPNVGGLLRAGGNTFLPSASSGDATVGFSGETTGTTVLAGALEGSNVDIAEEFTDMIVTQRGFQASARVITAADDMLAEAINLRR